jgi:hypothetical protein
MTTPDDHEPALTPEESLRLIERQRAATLRQIVPNPLLMYLPWGSVWLVGYGLFFLHYGPSGRSLVAMPAWLPGVVLGCLIALSIGVTIFSSARAGRGVKGPSDERGLYYGLSWFLAFALMTVLGSRISPHLPGAEAGLYWSATSTSILTVLYVAGAAVWRDRSMFVLGTWVAAVNIVGVVAGVGWHALVVAIGGGGGLIAMGVFLYFRTHRQSSRQSQQDHGRAAA